VTWGLKPKIDFYQLLGCYPPFCFFTADWVCAKKYSAPTEYAAKNIPRPLSVRQKLFHAHWVCGKWSWQIFQIMPRPLSVRQKLFLAHWVCGKNFATPTECAAKIIPRPLSMRQKLFHAHWVCGKNYSKKVYWVDGKQDGRFLKLFLAHWVCGKNYFTPTECAAKIMPRTLSVRQKLFHVHWVCGKNFATPTEYAVKLTAKFSKFFRACWVCGTKYSTRTEYAVKIMPRPLSMR